MKLFIAAAPLFNSEMAVEAYRLKYDDSQKIFGLSADYTALDGAMRTPGLDLVKSVGVEPFTGGKKLFVDVNHYQIMAGALEDGSIEPESIVCVLNKDFLFDENLLRMCRGLKLKGFAFAIEGLIYSRDFAPFFEIADFTAYKHQTAVAWNGLFTVSGRLPYMRYIIGGLTDNDLFESVRDIPNTWFEGAFFTKPYTKGERRLSPLKANYLRLLKLVGDESFEIYEVARVVQTDAALSLYLLRYINSAGMGLSQKVNSISQAVALLGIDETRKWIMVVVSTSLAEDKPGEITRLSLVRAKFAENLAGLFGLKGHGSRLFLMGLFSLIGVVMDMPIHEAIEEISVEGEMKEALVYQTGLYAGVLKLVYFYERADWAGVSYITITEGVDAGGVNDAYIDALKWYRDMLEGMKKSIISM